MPEVGDSALLPLEARRSSTSGLKSETSYWASVLRASTPPLVVMLANGWTVLIGSWLVLPRLSYCPKTTMWLTSRLRKLETRRQAW